MKNKVGIVTYYSFYNYGSVCQAYALSKVIEELEYTPYLIDFANLEKSWNRQLRRKVLLDRIIVTFMHPSVIKKTLLTKWMANKAIKLRDEEIQEKFESFIKEMFQFPDEDYIKNDKDFVSFICGSDQIWQLEPPGLHYIFFLRFCSQYKRISYAASFGTTTVPEYNRKRLSKYLNEFKTISVREDIGLNIVRENSQQKNVVQVLDPVLLKKSIWWEKIMAMPVLPSKYIVCYFLGSPEDYLEVIRKKAIESNLSIIWIATGFEQPIGDDITFKPTVNEFIGIIKFANLVFTDSLHGMEFSIIFHKHFYICERNYLTSSEQKSRIESLLNLLDLKKISFKYNADIINFDFRLDYMKIDEKLKEMRNFSMQYLKNALNTID